jgi:hypothetical protein
MTEFSLSPLERYVLIRAAEIVLAENKMNYERAHVLRGLRDRLIGESHDDWKAAHSD